MVEQDHKSQYMEGEPITEQGFKAAWEGFNIVYLPADIHTFLAESKKPALLPSKR